MAKHFKNPVTDQPWLQSTLSTVIPDHAGSTACRRLSSTMYICQYTDLTVWYDLRNVPCSAQEQQTYQFV
jgi:hypothetical protein